MKQPADRRRWRLGSGSLRTGAIAALCAQLLACAAAPTEHFYRLGSPPPVALPVAPQPASGAPDPVGAGTPGHAGDIRLVVTAIPESIDRPQIVLQRGPNEMLVYESERWAEPVRSGIAQTLARGLGREMPHTWIVTDGGATDDKAPTVSVTIVAMDADGAQARLQARWRVRSADGLARVSDEIVLQRPLAAGTPADAVAAWSAQLGEIAQAIARSVRELPTGP